MFLPFFKKKVMTLMCQLCQKGPCTDSGGLFKCRPGRSPGVSEHQAANLAAATHHALGCGHSRRPAAIFVWRPGNLPAAGHDAGETGLLAVVLTQICHYIHCMTRPTVATS